MQTGIINFGFKLNLKEFVCFNVNKRLAGTFTSVSGKSLWNSTSPEKRRTGRGKRARVRRREDFSNRHMLGEGDAGILWPGLNAKVHREWQQRSEEDQEAFISKQNELKHAKRFFKKPTERGWSGGHYPGMKLGPPEPIEGQNFYDFNSVIMDVARVSHMDGTMGRVYSTRAMVAVGNYDGLIGIGMCVSPTIAGAFRKARQKAANRLMFVERFENRTLFEDLYVNHHKTWLSMRQQPEGYGLRCHRALRDICKLIGFKDIYIKVSGSTTMLNLLKCFTKGILEQETHQQKADRLRYHVVEFDQLRHNYPRVLASPTGETVSEPHDDYGEYLNQELILRDIKMLEGTRRVSFIDAIRPGSRGAPVPKSRTMPTLLSDIQNLKID